MTRKKVNNKEAKIFPAEWNWFRETPCYIKSYSDTRPGDSSVESTGGQERTTLDKAVAEETLKRIILAWKEKHYSWPIFFFN